MAENSRKSSENRRMQWLSGSNNIGDSFYTFTTTKESGYEQSGRFDVKQRIAHLYHKQLYTDVTFFIKCDAESNSTLHAHKAILAAGSQYFAQMLFESQDILSETTEPVKQVQISGISPEAFKNVIEFLYTDEICSDNDALVMETFLAAKQFEIQPLIDRCVSHLEEIELSKFVVCSMLQIAIQRKMNALKDRCLTFIQENTGDVIRTEDFMKSPLSVVRTICELQSLNLASEIELIIAVFRWAEHQNASSRRVAIEPVLKCLRFLVLESKIFSNLVKDYPDIFTPTEALQIIMYLTNPCNRTDELPSWCNKGADRCSWLKSSMFFCTKVDRKTPSGLKKLTVALKPVQRKKFLSSLKCTLEIKCKGGKFQIIGLKLLFREPVTKLSLINPLTVTVAIKPTNFWYKEVLKIAGSKEVQFTFQKRIVFSEGEVASIQASAENAEFYNFLQFDEGNFPEFDPRFECSLGSSAKENKLFFIYEVFYVEFPLRRPPSRRSNW